MMLDQKLSAHLLQLSFDLPAPCGRLARGIGAILHSPESA
jgi:hypothetical protein